MRRHKNKMDELEVLPFNMKHEAEKIQDNIQHFSFETSQLISSCRYQMRNYTRKSLKLEETNQIFPAI